MTFCASCKDQFDPIESREEFTDPDEPQFCSTECADIFWEAVEIQQIIEEAGHAGLVF